MTSPPEFRKIAAVIFVAACLLSAQAGESPKAKARGELLRELQARSWEARSSAFYQLIELGLGRKFNGETSRMPSIVANLLTSEPAEADRTKSDLIGLLSQENAFVREQRERFDKTGETLTEGYVNYYGDLIAAVASLNDPRSLDALVGAMTTGDIATRGLASLGRPALQPVLHELGSPDPLTRVAVLSVLSEMARSQWISGDPGARRLVKDAVVEALADPNPQVRIFAVRVASELGDPSLRPLLAKLASSDPYQSELPGQAGTYPVRRTAKEALDHWRDSADQ